MEVYLHGLLIKMDDEFLGYLVKFSMEVLETSKTNVTGIHPMFLQDFS